MEALDRLLTVDDLAEYLDVPVATIYAWSYRRQGPPGFRVGRHLRFRQRDVVDWIIEQLRRNEGDRQSMSAQGVGSKRFVTEPR
jgi:excisionase family DNA binding protein